MALQAASCFLRKYPPPSSFSIPPPRGFLHCHNWAQLCVCACVCFGWGLSMDKMRDNGCVSFWHACCLSPVICKTWQRFVFFTHSSWHFTDWHWNQSTKLLFYHCEAVLLSKVTAKHPGNCCWQRDNIGRLVALLNLRWYEMCSLFSGLQCMKAYLHTCFSCSTNVLTLLYSGYWFWAIF